MTVLETIDHHFEMLAVTRRERQLPLRPLNLLVVDDDENDLNLLRKLVVGYGHDLTETRSCEAAIKLIKEKPATLQFDLVLMDIAMPLVDGIECSKKLKQLVPELPIVFLTGHLDENTIERAKTALSEGYIAFLPKDFDGNMLRELFKKHRLI